MDTGQPLEAASLTGSTTIGVGLKRCRLTKLRSSTTPRCWTSRGAPSRLSRGLCIRGRSAARHEPGTFCRVRKLMVLNRMHARALLPGE